LSYNSRKICIYRMFLGRYCWDTILLKNTRTVTWKFAFFRDLKPKRLRNTASCTALSDCFHLKAQSVAKRFDSLLERWGCNLFYLSHMSWVGGCVFRFRNIPKMEKYNPYPNFLIISSFNFAIAQKSFYVIKICSYD